MQYQRWYCDDHAIPVEQRGHGVAPGGMVVVDETGCDGVIGPIGRIACCGAGCIGWRSGTPA